MESDERDENAPTKSQHVVHVMSQGDARVAALIAPQLDRIDAGVAGVQVLVIVPSPDAAAWLARLVNGGRAEAASLLVPVTAPARAARLIASGAHALAVTPSDALALVRGSALKLDTLRSIAFIDMNELLESSASDLGTLLAEAPKDAERIAVASEHDDAVRDFVESHMRRARRLAHDPLPTFGTAVQYVVAAPSERATVLRGIFDLLDPVHATVVADESSRDEAARALAALGYSSEGRSIRLSDGDVAEKEALAIVFDSGSARGLETVLAANPVLTIVLVTPERLATFLRSAVGRATPLALSAASGSARAADEALRDEVSAILAARSLHREVLALESLFSAHDPVHVAAAVLRLLETERSRARKPAARPAASAVSLPNEQRPTIGGIFTKLFINAGERDGAKKGDIVGAITGESGIGPEQIGKIEMRDSHSVVEVAPEAAEKVIAALNGSTIRGRTIMARLDRGPLDRLERSSERDAGAGGDRPDRGGERGDRGDRGGDRPPRTERAGGFGASRDRGGAPPPRGGARGGFRGERSGGSSSFRGERSGGFRGERSGGFRGAGDRERGAGGGERGGFRGERPAGGGERGGYRGERPAGGGARFDRGADRGSDRGGARGGPPRPGAARGGPPRGGSARRDDAGPARERGAGVGRDEGPRAPRREDEGRTPRALGESSEWSERGDRLKNARGRRTDG